MIIDFMVSTLLGFLSSILSLVPPWTLPTATVDGATAGRWLSMANRFLPLGDIGIILAAGIVYALAVSLWHLIIFVYHNIPIFGGSQ